MGKRILYLTFYFEPDLCAGSFRNSPLVHELAKQAMAANVDIDVLTTLPNRYSSYSAETPEEEKIDNLFIKRIKIPTHQSGVSDQIKSFQHYFSQVRKHVKEKKYDLVFASSSRLFTAYLGYRIAKSKKLPLYLDIRDIFVDTIKDVFPNPFIKAAVLPILKYIEAETFNYASHINIISGGFKEYFKKYTSATYTEYSNGIDPVFIDAVKLSPKDITEIKTILYAGNIGEGQGLHHILPVAAKKLGHNYKFKIIGDGGAKAKLVTALKDTSNVEILPPVNRVSLVEEYNKADFLFIHLNDYEAFKKVLPSKIFELGVFPKPLIAGVNGYSKQFIENHLPGSILIEPCNGNELADKIKACRNYTAIDRSLFIEGYKRETINRKMAQSILSYL